MYFLVRVWAVLSDASFRLGLRQVHKGHCVKLLKSLYGLKQAPRNWIIILHEFVVYIGLWRSLLDPCMYVGAIDTYIHC